MTKRGRPRGPNKATSKLLDAVADLMAKDSGLTRNAAIVKVHKSEKVADDIENFRRKMWRWWDRQGEERLGAAKERRAEADERRVVRVPRIDTSAAQSAMAQMRRQLSLGQRILGPELGSLAALYDQSAFSKEILIGAAPHLAGLNSVSKALQGLDLSNQTAAAHAALAGLDLQGIGRSGAVQRAIEGLSLGISDEGQD